MQLVEGPRRAGDDREEPACPGPRPALLRRRPVVRPQGTHRGLAAVRAAVRRRDPRPADGDDPRRPRHRPGEPVGRGRHRRRDDGRAKGRLLLPAPLRSHGRAAADLAPARPGRPPPDRAGHRRLLHSPTHRRNGLRHPRRPQVQNRPGGRDPEDGPAAGPHQRPVVRPEGDRPAGPGSARRAAARVPRQMGPGLGRCRRPGEAEVRSLADGVRRGGAPARLGRQSAAGRSRLQRLAADQARHRPAEAPGLPGDAPVRRPTPRRRHQARDRRVPRRAVGLHQPGHGEHDLRPLVVAGRRAGRRRRAGRIAAAVDRRLPRRAEQPDHDGRLRQPRLHHDEGGPPAAEHAGPRRTGRRLRAGDLQCEDRRERVPVLAALRRHRRRRHAVRGLAGAVRRERERRPQGRRTAAGGAAGRRGRHRRRVQRDHRRARVQCAGDGCELRRAGVRRGGAVSRDGRRADGA